VLAWTFMGVKRGRGICVEIGNTLPTN